MARNNTGRSEIVPLFDGLEVQCAPVYRPIYLGLCLGPYLSLSGLYL